MKTLNFDNFLLNLKETPIKIIDPSISLTAYTPIDLSVFNPDLKKNHIQSSKDFDDFITGYLQSRQAKVAYGGYNEERAIYKRSSHFKHAAVEERNIHLGLDIWASENTVVVAPVDGLVYGFADNAGLGNYGPTLILKHDIEGVIFYTLYGHLTRASLSNLKIDTKISEGDIIAQIGSAEVNGDYPPHLHFQIIKNIENWVSDYPGVCSKSERDMYLENCPNPNLLLKIQS